MKIHIGCGTTILDGFVNIDNSPTALFSKLPNPILSFMKRLSLLNPDQAGFASQLRKRKKDFLYANCMKLPFKDNSVDFGPNASPIAEIEHWFRKLDFGRDRN